MSTIRTHQCNVILCHIFSRNPNRKQRHKKNVIHSLSIVLNVVIFFFFFEIIFGDSFKSLQGNDQKTTPNKWCWNGRNYGSGEKKSKITYLFMYFICTEKYCCTLLPVRSAFISTPWRSQRIYSVFDCFVCKMYIVFYLFIVRHCIALQKIHKIHFLHHFYADRVLAVVVAFLWSDDIRSIYTFRHHIFLRIKYQSK